MNFKHRMREEFGCASICVAQCRRRKNELQTPNERQNTKLPASKRSTNTRKNMISRRDIRRFIVSEDTMVTSVALQSNPKSLLKSSGYDWIQPCRKLALYDAVQNLCDVSDCCSVFSSTPVSIEFGYSGAQNTFIHRKMFGSHPHCDTTLFAEKHGDRTGQHCVKMFHHTNRLRAKGKIVSFQELRGHTPPHVGYAQNSIVAAAAVAVASAAVAVASAVA